jgi:hypothetical protein
MAKRSVQRLARYRLGSKAPIELLLEPMAGDHDEHEKNRRRQYPGGGRIAERDGWNDRLIGSVGS